MTSIGGNIELKEIGLAIGTSGTHFNTEIDEQSGHLRLVSNGDGYEAEGYWISDIIDLGDNFKEFGKVFATDIQNGGSNLAIQTHTSDNGIDFNEWLPVAMDGTIQSVKSRYIQAMIKLFAGYSDETNPIDLSTVTGSELVEFDNGLKLKTEHTFDMVQEGEVARHLVSRDEFKRIDGLEVIPEGKKIFLTDEGSYKYVDIDYDSPIPPLEIPSLISYFTFDEESGNVLGGKGNTVGTVYGNPQRVDLGDGRKAMNFNGTDQYVSFNDKVIPVGMKSIKFRIKTTSNINGIILSEAGWNMQGKSGISILKRDSGAIHVVFYKAPSNLSYNVLSNKTINDGQWHDVMFTWDGTMNANSLKLYIDDMTTPDVIATPSSLEEYPNSRDNLHLARASSYSGVTTTFYLQGQLDDIEIYNEVLTYSDLYESKKWSTETMIQNGSSDKLPKRQITSLPPTSMQIKSGVLPSNDEGLTFSAELDLKKYYEIKSILSSNPINLYKYGKYYNQVVDDITYDIKMTSNTTPAPYVVSSSSEFSDNYAYLAFEESNRKWQAASQVDTNYYIQFNFGEKTRISKLILTSDSPSTMIKTGSLLCSDDGINFTKVKDLSFAQWTQGETRTIELGNIYNYSIYRIKIDTNFAYEVHARNTTIRRIKFGLYEQDWIESDEITLDTTSIIVDDFFYETFSDSVEVLSYDSTGTVPTPSLQITANWSPLDELEGDFEVVILAEDNITRQLQLTAIPHPQFVKTVLIEDVKDITKITANSDGNAKYLISPNATDWYRFADGQFEQVNENDVVINGMTADELNALMLINWQSWSAESFSVGIYIPDENTVVNEVNYTAALPTSTHEVKNTSFYILNTTARIDVTLEGTLLTAYLSDADMTRIKYRVLVNGVPYRQSDTNEEGWTELSTPPKNILMNLYDESIVNINAYNTVRIEFQDFFGTVDYWEAQFYARKKKKGYSYAFVVHH